MAMIKRYDFTGDNGVHQGMPFAKPFRLIEIDGGAMRDLTGYTGTFTVYRNPATDESLHDNVPILSLSSGGGAIVLGTQGTPPTGPLDFGQFNVLLLLDRTITSNQAPWGMAKYNLDIIDPLGRPWLRFYGAIEFEEGRTHV